MEQEMTRPAFDKVILTGVFVGIIATVISLLFDAIFLQSTGLPFTALINVSSLIFSINLMFLVIGLIYYAFLRSSKYGTALFMIVFILFTIFLIVKVSGIERSDNAKWNTQFRTLLSTLIIIWAIGALAIPFLLRSKKFLEKVV